jgi:hypothetical protein
MATAAESTFIAAVNAAESVRQAAKAAAFTTWAFQPGAPLTTYIAAVLAADSAFFVSVNSARNTAALTLGNVGDSGPIAGNIARLAA